MIDTLVAFAIIVIIFIIVTSLLTLSDTFCVISRCTLPAKVILTCVEKLQDLPTSLPGANAPFNFSYELTTTAKVRDEFYTGI